RDAFVNRTLAAELGAADGATILVRVERPSAIPIESVHGRKDDLGRSLRLTVRATLAPGELGDFSLAPSQGEVRAVFVPLQRLQQDLDIAGRVNALLVADRPGATPTEAALVAAIRRTFTIEDVGLTVRGVDGERAIAVESATGLLDTARSTVIDRAARGST